MAVEMVVKLVNGETLEENLYEIPTQLVVRNSCRSLT
jgi:DNA-binding LacI/PurR family transcriptional regulator